MTPEELNRYKALLLQRRRILAGDVSSLTDQALQKGDGSHLPVHLADAGSDTFEQQFALGIVESEKEVLREIDEALDRIANNTYGLCEECDRPIPPARLEVIPYARVCVECKQKEEEGTVQR